MADISAEIAAFQNAVYGEDVRTAMVNLANKVNNESSAAATTVAGVSDEIDDLKSAIRYVNGAVNGGETQLLPASVNIDNRWNVNPTTLVASLEPLNEYNACDLIDISDFVDGTQVSIKSSTSGNSSAAILDKNLQAIDYVNTLNAESKGYIIGSKPQTITFTKTANTKYIVSTIRAAYYTGLSDFVTTGTSIGAFSVAKQAISETVSIRESLTEYITKETTIGTNLFNPETAEPGYLSSNAGAISGAQSGTYVTSDFIPVYANEPVIVRKFRDFLGYNSEKTALTSTYVNSVQQSYVYTPSADGYIRVSIAASEQKQVSYGNTLPPYEPYSEKIAVENGIHLSETMIDDVRTSISSGVLSGKKWVACGDSFTEGAYTNSPTDDYLFEDEPYMGQKKVYPFFIGRRNPDMIVINEAISGSTMGAGENGVNPFSGTRYTAIPADTDYITLEFGINDSGHGVPIGTIDDTDNTTFYGAWNVVLSYFAEHFPFAHIGIIVGPGMQGNGQQYANAEIAVAKKWGIPYLNVQFESGGGKIPLMLRTNCPDVSAEVKAACDARQFVNPSTETPNHHPNQYAHEFESTFIEAWLRTL